jgi:hypothetical protein
MGRPTSSPTPPQYYTAMRAHSGVRAEYVTAMSVVDSDWGTIAPDGSVVFAGEWTSPTSRHAEKLLGQVDPATGALFCAMSFSVTGRGFARGFGMVLPGGGSDYALIFGAASTPLKSGALVMLVVFDGGVQWSLVLDGSVAYQLQDAVQPDASSMKGESIEYTESNPLSMSSSGTRGRVHCCGSCQAAEDGRKHLTKLSQLGCAFLAAWSLWFTILILFRLLKRFFMLRKDRDNFLFKEVIVQHTSSHPLSATTSSHEHGRAYVYKRIKRGLPVSCPRRLFDAAILLSVLCTGCAGAL